MLLEERNHGGLQGKARIAGGSVAGSEITVDRVHDGEANEPVAEYRRSKSPTDAVVR